MSMHLHREIDLLKSKIVVLAAMVRRAVQDAVQSVVSRDRKLAQEIIDGDQAIDQAEVDVEEDCLKLLALYQPVATDLRFIIAVLKINNDIERVGDLAVNIAERTIAMASQPSCVVSFEFNTIQEKALAMLSGSLESLVHLDVEKAREIPALDNEVDALNREMYAKVSAAVLQHPEHVEYLLNYLSVSRYLERIADYATNVAEDVIYLIEGQIVRHKGKK